MVTRVFSAVPRGVEALRVQVEVDARPSTPRWPSWASRTPQSGRPASACWRRSATSAASSTPAPSSSTCRRPRSARKGRCSTWPWPVGILAACGRMPEVPARLWLLGELSLDGVLRPVRGVLPIVEAATADGAAVLLPADNLAEAAVVRGARLLPAPHPGARSSPTCEASARSPRSWRQRRPTCERAARWPRPRRGGRAPQAKRALEIAAAGGHHLLMLGPPGGRQDHARAATSRHPACRSTRTRRWPPPRCTRSPSGCRARPG